MFLLFHSKAGLKKIEGSGGGGGGGEGECTPSQMKKRYEETPSLTEFHQCRGEAGVGEGGGGEGGGMSQMNK